MIIIVFAVIIYRIAIAALLYLPLVAIGGNAVGAGASLFASITGACVQLVFIMVMNVVSPCLYSEDYSNIYESSPTIGSTYLHLCNVIFT